MANISTAIVWREVTLTDTTQSVLNYKKAVDKDYDILSVDVRIMDI